MENQYLGSCVEVGDDNSCNYINDIFSDATEMAYYVGDPDDDDFGQSEEISRNEFFKNIDVSVVERKILKVKLGFIIYQILKFTTFTTSMMEYIIFINKIITHNVLFMNV